MFNATAIVALVGMVVTIIGSALAAYLAVRVGQARDTQRIATLETELVRLRDSVHEDRTRVGTAFLELGSGIKEVQLEVAKLHGKLEEGAQWRTMVLDLIKMVLAANAGTGKQTAQ